MIIAVTCFNPVIKLINQQDPSAPALWCNDAYDVYVSMRLHTLALRHTYIYVSNKYNEVIVQTSIYFTKPTKVANGVIKAVPSWQSDF